MRASKSILSEMTRIKYFYSASLCADHRYKQQIGIWSHVSNSLRYLDTPKTGRGVLEQARDSMYTQFVHAEKKTVTVNVCLS